LDALLPRLHHLNYEKKRMAYSGRTTFYQIPIALDGDILDEAENIQQMQMVDDLLESAVGIVGTGVIKEGNFSIVTDTGSGYKVLLKPVSGNAIHGLLGSGLASSKSQVTWEGLYSGNFYYLYLRFTTNLYENSAAFTTTVRTTPVSSDNFNFLYMATLDLTGGSPVLDINPEGKVYAREFTTHIGTSVNPHTNYLTQTNLTVTGSISGNLNPTKSIWINQEDVLSTAPLITFNHVTSGAPLIRSLDELSFQDVRMSTKLSASGQTSFINGKTSLVGAINQNTAFTGIGVSGNTAAIAQNTADIAVNTSDITSNIGNIATNNANILSNATNINTNESNIFSNSVSITGNAANILINQASITGNAVSISGNAANVLINISGINAVSGQVDTNTSNLVIHQAQLLNTQQRVRALECAVFGCSSSSSSSSSSS